MPDFDDPWDDPATLPAPGAYSYRNGSGYNFTAAQASQVGSLGAAYPWVSPGVAVALGTTDPNMDTAPVADLSLYSSVEDGTANQPSPARRSEKRRNVRQAKQRIRWYGEWVSRYADALEKGKPTRGAGRPLQTKEDIAQLKAIGILDDPVKARQFANNLSALHQAGPEAERDILRFGRALQKMNSSGDSSDLGAFIASPLAGAATTLGAAANIVGKVYRPLDNITPNGPLDEESKTVSRYAAAGLQYPYDVLQGTLRTEISQLSSGDFFAPPLSKEAKQDFTDTFANIAEQSPLIQNVLHGKSLGSGYLPDVESPAYKAAGEAAREQSPYLIGDHAWTPGRALADLVVDPEDNSFQYLSGFVDGAIALKLDPANIMLETVAGARAAPILTKTAEGENALKAAGGLRGIRNRVNVTTARSWLLGEDGYRVISAYKDMAARVANGTISLTNATDVANRAFDELPLSVHKKLLTLGDAPDSAFYNILREQLGADIRDPLNTNRVVGGRFLLGSKSKMWSTLPPDMIDLTDPDQAIREINAAGRNINAPEETIKRLRNMIIESSDTPAQNEAIARATMDMFSEAFAEAGANREWVNRLTRLTTDRIKDAGVYDIDEDGLAAHFPFVQVNDRGVPLADPASLIEMRNSAFHIPNARDSRRIVSGLGQFLDTLGPQAIAAGEDNGGTRAFKAMESSIDVLDHVQSIWKQAVLMRPAWGLRVIAEEQLRMAASGKYSMFRSPMSALAWVLGNPNDADFAKQFTKATTVAGAVVGAAYGASQDGLEGAVLGGAAGGAIGHLGGRAVADNMAADFAKFKNRFGRGGSGLGGASFADDEVYQGSQYGGTRNFLPGQREKIHTGFFDSIDYNHPAAPEAYAQDLYRQAQDPVTRAILSGAPLDDIKDAFWSGDLASVRTALAEAPDRPQAIRQWHEINDDRALSDAYIDYMADRLQRVTNSNPAFLEAMRTGKYNNKPLVLQFGRNQVAPNPDLYGDADWIDAVRSSAPNKIRAERAITRTVDESKRSLSRIRKTFDAMFDALMPRPSNYLSRSSHFRQAYWQRVEELFPEMTTKARVQAIADARQANLDADTIRRLEIMHSTAGKGSVTLKNADTIAKRYGLDSTRDLLYDLSEKSQFFEQTRLLFPFGEAWKEIITRWAKLISEHPNVIRRGQQAILAARAAKVDPITGLPDPGGIGFFHRDITTGDENFIFPLTGALSEKAVGVPIPLTGSVQGLNMIGTGLPGVGFVYQFPIAAILPDSPRWDGVRNLLFPFGEPTGDNPLDVASSTLFPAWIKKMDQAFSDPNVNRLQGNVVAAVMQYKLSTGEYDTSGPNAQDEIARLYADSRRDATQFTIFRGIAQAGLPTAPSPEFLVKHGSNLVVAAKIAEQYQKKAEKLGWDEAFTWLLETYGPDTALLLAQPRSKAKITGINSTTAQLNWERNNPTMVTRFPDTWTMFAPNAGDFDIGAYNEEFKRQQREALSPIDMIHEANDRLARHEYYRVRDRLEADGKISDVEQAQLNAYRNQLTIDYPGYDPNSYTDRLPAMILQLNDAVNDPYLARTDAGIAIKTYLSLRDQGYAAAKKAGYSSPWNSKSTKAKAIRGTLFSMGEQLRREVPDFRVAWDEVFSREFKET